MTTRKTATKKATVKKATAKKAAMPAEGKDPKGGLTAAGRRYFREKDGSELKPGVKGAADSPEKMLRKGSFLRRHYANPRGPVADAEGKPTRQALQAAAWGEPVPKSEGDEAKLAEKGSKLLEQYHAAKGDAPGKAGGKRSASKKSQGQKA
ncbi:MAG: hypothetical protein NVSMB3_07380 [Acidobacteriaceae bacterium]